jgi:hypothetical protein
MKKFEFVFYINKNIIVQRFFNIKNYNKDVLRSVELVDCIKNVSEIIKKDLKDKSIDFLWKNYDEFAEREVIEEQLKNSEKNIYENEDIYDFEIKVDDKVVAHTQFTGNVYPQRVRYSVDVRKLIPSIISEIQYTFSQENFDVEYNEISL